MSTDLIDRRMVYQGRRRSNGKTVHAWMDPETGQQCVFEGVPAASPGGVYDARVRLHDGTVEAMSPSVSFVETWDVEVDRAGWQALHRAAMNAEQKASAEKRLARHPDLNTTLDPLEEIARRCRTLNEVYALGDLVKQRLVDAFFKKGG